jgi:FAD/FMN-containing dehydrogenase
LLLSVKGGGHNIGGIAIAEGGLLLDMSQMRFVNVEPDARLVHVGPGCLLGDVDRETQRYGLATVLGVVSEVGVAGLTLGGGFGYLARRFGWAVDNLEEVEIVTADGAIRTANRQENADLFWAVRGGGGNFGIVTRFTFRLHEVGPMVTGGMIVWSAEEADTVKEMFLQVAETSPRELAGAMVYLLAPPAPFVPVEWHFKPVIVLVVCHSGENAEADLAPIRAAGTPIMDLITERPYVEQQSMLNEMEPKGLNQYWKSEYLSSVSREFLDTFMDCARTFTSPMSYSILFFIGGAINERPVDDGAVGNRDARFIAGFAGVWPPDDTRSDEHIAWARTRWERIRPYCTGGNYVNFHLAEDGESRTAESYGPNLRRLQQVKAVYDPGNLFRSNRNILPRG